ncbi:MAG: GTP 3',8-cyclase MoaA [Gammaproteobacteria bacterium]|nr:GTP 3',8-cyclase MoaA [Gammaproteobacteria bacterium]
MSVVPDTLPLGDRFGRHITYLRVSLTEHCNLRCQYCSPAEGTPRFTRADHLRPAELDTLLSLFHTLGIRHMRFTGGEPLLYPWLLDRVAHVRALGVAKVSLSTNGYLLDRLARPLADAGLHRLNVSLDSLDPARFADITRGGDLERVKRGLFAARAVIPAIKLNVVLLRDKNLAEVPALVEFARAEGFDIQFIETMPLGVAGSDSRNTAYASVEEARALLAGHTELQAIAGSGDEGPARRFTIPGSGMRIGFISPISENFCAGCNRLRLTATGRLVYCLGQSDSVDLLPLLREGRGLEDLARFIRQKVWLEKPERHTFNDDPERAAPVYMMRLGG